MEFGRIPEEELDKIDFKLPPDPLFNTQILEGKAMADPKVYVGCAKWGRVEWVGKIYPPKTKEKNFLGEYVHHYNSIELNATRSPSRTAIWWLRMSSNASSNASTVVR